MKEDLFTLLKNAKTFEDAFTIETLLFSTLLHSEDDRILKLMRKAEDYMVYQNDKKAFECYEKVLSIDSTNIEAYAKKASIHFSRGHYKNALSDLENVLAVEPRHYPALTGVGLCYDKLKDYGKAIQAFKRVLAIHPWSSVCTTLQTSRKRMEEEEKKTV